jgi:hypothetical protein
MRVQRLHEIRSVAPGSCASRGRFEIEPSVVVFFAFGFFVLLAVGFVVVFFVFGFFVLLAVGFVVVFFVFGFFVLLAVGFVAVFFVFGFFVFELVVLVDVVTLVLVRLGVVGPQPAIREALSYRVGHIAQIRDIDEFRDGDPRYLGNAALCCHSRHRDNGRPGGECGKTAVGMSWFLLAQRCLDCSGGNSIQVKCQQLAPSTL